MLNVLPQDAGFFICLLLFGGRHYKCNLELIFTYTPGVLRNTQSPSGQQSVRPLSYYGAARLILFWAEEVVHI